MKTKTIKLGRKILSWERIPESPTGMVDVNSIRSGTITSVFPMDVHIEWDDGAKVIWKIDSKQWEHVLYFSFPKGQFFTDSDPDLSDLSHYVKNLVMHAVLAEKERCARIAYLVASDEQGSTTANVFETAKLIEKKILEGEEK